VNTGLAELKKLGRLTDESQNSSDITAQYVDLTARLSNARNTEQRLLALLRERTGNLKDVVEVERELASVREGIERMEAQQKDLNNKVQYATIQLELAEEYRAQLAPPAPSAGAEVRNALVDGIRSAGENALDIVLFLLRYGPTLLMWLIVIGPIAFALWRFRRRIPIF
jgi:chromosome segregation ATPase